MRSFLSSAFFLLLGLFALSQAQENGGKILDPGFAGPGMRNLEGKVAVWPDVVGEDGEAACAEIRSQRPDLKIVAAIPENAPVTRDMRFDRVRVFVDEEGKVVKPPRVG